MARIRTVKPGLFRHEALFDAEQQSGLPLRLAFVGLFTVADREGRFRWRPRHLKLDVLPYDSVDMEAVLKALEAAGFICAYEVEGERLAFIPSWQRHQVINNRESPSELPPPVDHGSALQDSRDSDACATRAQHVPHASGTPAAPAADATPKPQVRAQAEGEGEQEEEQRTTEEPDGSSSSPKATVQGGRQSKTPCPYSEIVTRYHEALPMLPQVRLMQPSRKKAMGRVWDWVLSSTKADGSRRATNAQEALRWFADYFARAATNGWLTGKSPRTAEHANWQCDIDFLLTDRGMRTVIEKTEAAT
jgi:hypothetical protein